MIIYIVIITYLILLVGLGFVFKKFNTDVADYFRSGSKATWWLVGTSIFVAAISAKTFTGNSGVAYEAGWTIMIDYVAGAAGAFIQAIFLAHLFRQTRAITYAELVRDRFGPRTQFFYACVTVVLWLLSGGIWLWGLSIFLSTIFGFNIYTLIIGLGLVVLLYSTMGGTWAIMATDFVQGIIMFVMAGLLTVLCIIRIGGVSEIFLQIRQAGLTEQFQLIQSSPDLSNPDPYQYTAPWAGALAVFVVLSNISMRSAVKFFSVKTGKEARFAAILVGVLFLFAMTVFFIPPIAARLLFADQVSQLPLSKPAEGAFAVASMELLPNSLVGIMVVAMFAATMSSMDTALNRNAAFIVRDIIPAILKKFKRSVPDSTGQMRIGQAFTAFFGFVVISIAIYYASLDGLGMFEVALNIGALLTLPIAVPLILGIIIKKTPSWSAAVTIAAGLVPSLWSIIDSQFYSNPWPYHSKVFGVLLAGGITFVLTRFFWRFAPSTEQKGINEFFKVMHTPIDFEKEVGRSNDHLQLKMLGTALMGVAAFVALLLMAPQSAADRICVLAVVFSLFMLGALMYVAGRIKSKKLDDNLQSKIEHTAKACQVK